MNNKVLLVQRGIAAQSHAISGKSLKHYGMAIQDVVHKGVVFEMSAEDYSENAHDLIGNTLAGQQWVPVFIANPIGKQELGFCMSPSCRLGENDRPAEASYIQGRSLFCATHAPLDATPLYPGAPKIGAMPVGKVWRDVTEMVEDVQPKMIERVAGQMQEKSDGYTPPEKLPPPVVGSAEEGDEPKLIGGVERPIPMPGLPVKTAVPEDHPKASNDAGTDPKGLERPLLEVISGMVQNTVKQEFAGLEERLMTAIGAKTTVDRKTRTNGAHGKANRRKPSGPPAEPTAMQKLQRDAKELKINTFGKSKSAIQAEIDAKLRAPAPLKPVAATEPVEFI